MRTRSRLLTSCLRSAAKLGGFAGQRTQHRPTPPARRVRLLCQPLEGRVVPAAWIAQGPGPTNGGQVVLPANNSINGGIQAIAPHPTNADILYVGAVNGGVWKTTNATAASPTWTPLTDNFPSLSIGDIQFDPTDASAQTLIVGTGRWSNFNRFGDQEVGLYYTTNGGASFTLFNDPLLINRTTSSVIARGTTLIASNTASGVVRSTNGGTTWTNISGLNNLKSGGVSTIVGDPTDNNRLYAAVTGVGVFRTDNLGNTWTNVSTGLTGVAASPYMRLAVNASAGVVFVVVPGTGQGTPTAVFRSTNQGGAWTPMDTFVVHNGKNQQSVNTSIAAHPTNSNRVYIGGDRIAASPFTASIAMGNAALSAGSQWTTIVDGNGSNTAPHADSRDMEFDANGNLLESNDGGIARRTSPHTTAGSWSSIGGNIQAMEVHDVAWNAVNNTVMIGTQDNGNHMQPTSGATTWNNITANSGDGGDVAIDSVSKAGSNQAIRYFSSQNLGVSPTTPSGDFKRQIIDSNNNVVSTTSLATISSPGFVTPIEINTIDPSRLLIGGSSALFESTDQGTTNTSLGFPGSFYLQNALVYGGSLNGTPNADLIYFASSNFVYKRTTSGGAITATTAFPGGADQIRDVAIEPNNYNAVFAADDDQVFFSIDGGTNWTDITGNLALVSPGLDIRTITYVPAINNLYQSYVAIGTRSGVFISSAGDFGTWTGLRAGLPDVLVYDLVYNATDNILVAGTLGRSVWTLSSAGSEGGFLSRVVNTNLDVVNDGDGFTSLREVLEFGNIFTFSADTISFSSFFNSPRTIALTIGELPISHPTTINAPGSGLLTISGNNNSRIFNTDAAPANAVVTIRGITLTNGKGTDGGAIYIGDENVTVEDSVITLCSASDDGGAINVQSAGSFTIRRSTISGNVANSSGGGIYFNNGGSLDLFYSAVVNNTAKSGDGGGVYFFGTANTSGAPGVRVLSSTISGNSAASGGGGVVLRNFYGNFNVSQSTIVGNFTSAAGGGIARTGGSGTITLTNTIVSGNIAPASPDVSSNGTVNVNYSAIGSTSGFTITGGNNLIDQDLKLRPINNNGGPTPTVAFEFDSPLRSKASSMFPFNTDQRGFPRNNDGIDIGAFELQTTVVNANNSGTGSLRDAVAESNRVVGTDLINFGSLFNSVQTITLLTGEIALTDAVTVQGNGTTLTQISGNTISRIFNTTAIPAGKTVTIRGLTLTAGSAAANGGAILGDDEYLIVEDSGISSSYASADGGAIYVGTGKLTLNRSTLVGNSAFGNGGALRFVNGGNSEIISSALISNKSGNGGAIYIDGGGSTLTVLNSTLSGNSAAFGGGITTVDFFSTLTVRNSTLTANTATNSGGGVRTFNGAPNIDIESTIVAGNTAIVGLDIFSNTTLIVNRSAIGSADGFTLVGADNLPFGANLKLGALATNGGTTLNYLPANDSPLVNAGSNPNNLALDQRGVVRTLFGATDIGSVESAIAPPDNSAPTITSITSGTPNGTYGPGSVIDIVVNFSEPVTLTGTLNVLFNNGGVGTITAQQPNFVTLTGTYYVAAGQATPDLNVTGFTLTGGSTLRDAANNDAVFTLPGSNFGVNKDIVITTPDVSAPTITSITSPTPNGTYGAGANIGVALNFSEAVTLSGYLFVFFDSGGSLLIQGPLTGTTLNGTYSVGFNQNSADLNVTAVQLQSGNSLTDSAGNNAVLTLPASNLANNSNIVVSTPATPTFTVTNTNDSGSGSLRQAVLDANNTSGFQNIVFNSTFNTAKTITLTSGELKIIDGVSITGPGANLLTINGNNAGRVFNVNSGSAVTISGVGITGGQASTGGGILFGANRPPLTLVDVRVFNNSATNQGGGIWAGDSSNFTITRSTISGNTAGSSGGGFYAQASSSTITDSSIVNNTCTFGSGGGFFSYAGLIVTNSTISGNSAAGLGGGIATGGVSVRNSTITNNKANSGGGGVARTFGNGSIAIDSSIVSGNTAPSPDISSGGTVNVNFSAIGSNTGFTLTGSNNLAFGTNLKLGALANNGGATLTHAILSDSPAINKGSNPAALSNDQRGPGYVRVSGGTTDIGSYEYYFSPLIVLNANETGAGSLRDAIAFANSNAGADTVSFEPVFFSTPRTVTLSSQLVLTDTTGATTLTGPGVNLLTVSGNNLSRAFLINSGVSGAITGMTIANGNSTYGGAVQNSGTVTVSSSRFTNNKSDYGGAIFSVGVLSVSNSSFDNNAANFGTGWGGAIINGTTAGAANLTACTFTNNYASSLGGAVIGYSFNITDSTFANNNAGHNGGALRTDGTVVITGSTFSGNTAANDGGAIMSHGSTTITNTTLANNTANGGGGIQFFQGTGTMRNVTIAYNTATTFSGGAHIGTASSVTAVNTIVAGNAAPTDPNAGGNPFNASSLNNLFNLSAAAAGLGTLANNGGPTQTIALLLGSPAINSGTSVGVPTTDQRGLTRVGSTDIGAYESQILQPAKVSQITVNGGNVQRSRVTSMVVTFSHPVTFATTPAAAFQLQRHSDGKLPNLSASVNSTRDVVTLTFLAGDAVDFGSLADGRYTLTIKAAQFASDGFDGNGNGIAGDNFVEVGAPGSGHNLFRLFGDADGDGNVAANDFIQFRLALGGSNTNFDFDGDGAVAAGDFIQFRLRFGGSV